MYQYENSFDPFIRLNSFALFHSLDLGVLEILRSKGWFSKKLLYSRGFLKISPGVWEGQAVIPVKIRLLHRRVGRSGVRSVG